MMVYSNITRHDGLSFNEYLKLPGYSNSFLKRARNGVAEDLPITDNIRTGSLVDSILTEPGKVDMSDPLYPIARDIAAFIKVHFGSILDKLQKQVSYTAEISYNGFSMLAKGRLDFLLQSIAVLDLKITKSRDVMAITNYMQYQNQVWHYSKMAKVNTAYLLFYLVPLKRCQLVKVDCSSETNAFWQEKIMVFGKVNEAA